LLFKKKPASLSRSVYLYMLTINKKIIKTCDPDA